IDPLPHHALCGSQGYLGDSRVFRLFNHDQDGFIHIQPGKRHACPDTHDRVRIPVPDMDVLEVGELGDAGIKNKLEQLTDDGPVVGEHMLGLPVGDSPVAPADTPPHPGPRPPATGIQEGCKLLGIPERCPLRFSREEVGLCKEARDLPAMGKQLLGQGTGDGSPVLIGDLFPDQPAFLLVSEGNVESSQKFLCSGCIVADPRDEGVIGIGEADVERAGGYPVAVEIPLADLD
ncbi:MAG: hypothetical protein HGA75_17265, partial [Thiobacillus sp.]|nr:hypothetical protein [Thiobacillus sp.]